MYNINPPVNVSMGEDFYAGRMNHKKLTLSSAPPSRSKSPTGGQQRNRTRSTPADGAENNHVPIRNGKGKARYPTDSSDDDRFASWGLDSDPFAPAGQSPPSPVVASPTSPPGRKLSIKKPRNSLLVLFGRGRSATVTNSFSHSSTILHHVEDREEEDTVLDIRAGDAEAEDKERGLLRDAAARSIGLIPNGPNGHGNQNGGRRSSVERPDTPPIPPHLSRALISQANASSAHSSLVSIPNTAFLIQNSIPTIKRTRTPPNIPSFPSTLSSLKAFTRHSSTLLKYHSGGSFILNINRSWRSRLLVLTSQSQSHLHVFKSASPEEKEVERLLLPDDGVVFVTDEFSGRRFVIKVGGIECLKPRGRATAGGTVSAPEDLGGPVIWLFQCENAVSMQFWIEHIKTVINMQKAEDPSLNVELKRPVRSNTTVHHASPVPTHSSTPAKTPSLRTSNLPATTTAAASSNHQDEQPAHAKSPSTRSSNARPISPTPSGANGAVQALKGLFSSNSPSTRPRSFSAGPQNGARVGSPAFSEDGGDSPVYDTSFGNRANVLLNLSNAAGLDAPSTQPLRIATPVLPPTPTMPHIPMLHWNATPYRTPDHEQHNGDLFGGPVGKSIQDDLSDIGTNPNHSGSTVGLVGSPTSPTLEAGVGVYNLDRERPSTGNSLSLPPPPRARRATTSQTHAPTTTPLNELLQGEYDKMYVEPGENRDEIDDDDRQDGTIHGHGPIMFPASSSFGIPSVLAGGNPLEKSDGSGYVSPSRTVRPSTASTVVVSNPEGREPLLERANSASRTVARSRTSVLPKMLAPPVGPPPLAPPNIQENAPPLSPSTASEDRDVPSSLDRSSSRSSNKGSGSIFSTKRISGSSALSIRSFNSTSTGRSISNYVSSRVPVTAPSSGSGDSNSNRSSGQQQQPPPRQSTSSAPAAPVLLEYPHQRQHPFAASAFRVADPLPVADVKSSPSRAEANHRSRLSTSVPPAPPPPVGALPPRPDEVSSNYSNSPVPRSHKRGTSNISSVSSFTSSTMSNPNSSKSGRPQKTPSPSSTHPLAYVQPRSPPPSQPLPPTPEDSDRVATVTSRHTSLKTRLRMMSAPTRPHDGSSSRIRMSADSSSPSLTIPELIAARLRSSVGGNKTSDASSNSSRPATPSSPVSMPLTFNSSPNPSLFSPAGPPIPARLSISSETVPEVVVNPPVESPPENRSLSPPPRRHHSRRSKDLSATSQELAFIMSGIDVSKDVHHLVEALNPRDSAVALEDS